MKFARLTLIFGLSILLLVPALTLASEEAEETTRDQRGQEEKVYEKSDEVVSHMRKYAKHIEGMNCDAKLKEEALSQSYNKLSELEKVSRDMRQADEEKKRASLNLLKSETKSGHELMRLWHGKLLTSRHAYAVTKLEQAISRSAERVEKLKEDEAYNDVDWNEVDTTLEEARKNLDSAKKALDEAKDAQDDQNFDLMKDKNKEARDFLKQSLENIKDATKVLKEIIKDHKPESQSFLPLAFSLS